MSVYNEKSSRMTLENKEILRLRDEHSGKRREKDTELQELKVQYCIGQGSRKCQGEFCH